MSERSVARFIDFCTALVVRETAEPVATRVLSLCLFTLIVNVEYISCFGLLADNTVTPDQRTGSKCFADEHLKPGLRHQMSTALLPAALGE